MTALASVELSAVVAALLCALGAVGARRQGWTVAACGLGTVALVGEAWRRGPDQRSWVLWAAPLLVAFGEFVRLAVDARRRGTRVTVEPSTYRQVAVGVGLVLAVVVVAGGAVLALPGSAGAGGDSTGDGAVSAWLLPAGVVVLGLAVVASAIGLGRLAGHRQAAGRSRLVVVAAVVSLVSGALVVGAAGLVRIGSGPTAVVTSPGVASASGEAEPVGFADDAPSRARTVRDPLRLSWWMSLLILVGFIVLIVVFGRREQLYPPEDLQPDRLVRGGPDLVTEGPTRIEVIDRAVTLATVEEALVGLRLDTDPRVAVRVAYATVAHGLGRQDLGRRPAETEGEYLMRAFGALGAGGDALRRLTELFSVARFSDDPVDEAMRAEALEALEQIRVQVAVAGPKREMQA